MTNYSTNAEYNPDTIKINSENRRDPMSVKEELLATFARNMQCFQQHHPDIFEYFKAHKPTELGLQVDQLGNIGLSNLRLNGRPVYSGDPELFCREQVKQYLNNPCYTSLNLFKTTALNSKHLHTKFTNEMLDTLQTYEQNSHPRLDIPCSLMLMTGCGLGYHLPLLLEKIEISHLVVYDPHADSFFASLYTIDWDAIITSFRQKGRSLALYVGSSPESVAKNLRSLKERIGSHNLIHTWIYRHFNSQAEEAFTNTFVKKNHLNFFGAGFFDDEQVGLAHTISNISRPDMNLFKSDPKSQVDIPVFIIGNGPSLDEQIEFIKHRLDSAIIISCGTSLSSLARAGIKPDFHVEMERNINISQWIEQGTKKQEREGITLLCLNTSSPAVLDLFDEVCIAKKPNDIGQKLMDENAGTGQQIHPLQFCNPTVTNAGLAFALDMGFKEIVLLGIDLGIRDDGKHHSTLSIYSKIEKFTKSKGNSPLENTDNNYFVEGNFGGLVSTNEILDQSRLHMETLIQWIRRENGDIKAYNPSKGAKINGFTPVQLEDIDLFELERSETEKCKGSVKEILRERKAGLIDTLKQRHFLKSKNIEQNLAEIADEISANLKKHKRHLMLRKNVSTVDELRIELDRVYEYITSISASDPSSYYLFKGSINACFLIIMKYCYYQPDNCLRVEAYRKSRLLYIKLIESAIDFMLKTPFALDDTYDNVISKLGTDYNS